MQNIKNDNSVKQDEGRLAVIERIKKLEAEGIFDVDVEIDPPTVPLTPDKVDYLKEKLSSRIKTTFVNRLAKKYIDNLIRDKKLIIKSVEGMENLVNLNCGAVIICNHFNAFDNFAIQKVYELSGQEKKRKLFKVIREGNYTSFKGLYGVFFRNCNTLPLSSVFTTMKNFNSAVKKILARGDYILIYPEQAMWWNYKKVRPFKIGAFDMAAKNNVPVLPIFISFEDSDIMGKDGFYVQEYTIHIMPPVYPKENITAKENAAYMLDRSYKLFKDKYAEAYGEEL